MSEKKKEEGAQDGREEVQHHGRLPVQWSGEKRRKGALLAYTLLEPLFIKLEQSTGRHSWVDADVIENDWIPGLAQECGSEDDRDKLINATKSGSSGGSDRQKEAD